MSTHKILKEFEIIYNQTYNKTLRFVICKCSNLDDVNDILQESYTELYKALKDKKKIDDKQAFIIGIARNKLRNLYTEKNRLKTTPIYRSSNNEEKLIEMPDETDIEVDYINKNNIDDIWKYLKDKDINTAKIFYLYFVQDMKIKEIAASLDKGESDIKNKLFRTLKSLKQRFGDVSNRIYIKKGMRNLSRKDIKKYFENQYSQKENLKAVLSNLGKEKDMKVKKITQMVAVFIAVIGVTAGIGYGTTVVHRKIFQEPKKYASYEEYEKDYLEQAKEAQGDQTVTDEERNKAIQVEVAEAEASKFLNELGYETQKFVIKDLKKNYSLSAELIYYLATSTNLDKGIAVGIDATNGNVVHFDDKEFLNKSEGIVPDELSKEDATKYADSLFNMFTLDATYNLHSIEETSYMSNNKEIKVWHAMYYKDYDGAPSQFERVEVNFYVKDGKVKPYSMYIANEHVNMENNPTEISKEEAEKIALEENKKITDAQVDYIVTNLQVRQPNSWIYALEQTGGNYQLNKRIKEDGDYEQYPVYSQQDNIARRVWTVNIHYIKGELDPNNDDKYNTKSIFVDVTTGEVIGGADESYWEIGGQENKVYDK